jgi:hypothetical protein
MSTGWMATVARATSNVQAFATAADRAGVQFGPGELTYLVDQKCFQFWDGAAWQTVANGVAASAELPPHTWHPGAPTTNATWIGANQTQHNRNLGAGTISGIAFTVGTVSGNVCVGVYAGGGGRGGPTTRLATSGSVPCPASGFVTVPLGTTLTVNQTNYLSLACDNATATFFASGNGGGGNPSGAGFCYAEGVFPLPAVASVINPYRSETFFLFGV